ncbi:hypothetical protein RS130_15830 [Paraglaciecola aquimarina]|uniref:Uncharacterized protein n=1 Tax=Paraglaciecola aquimarina TaxID=1235557 RepID=A0ABU3SYW1_9ALTE|nr:VolA/Pla-1 family phospholipase [Paraglaciecola aquimarina]MDU0355176.1 hypothetical protein [Paraglaciecola aquimarina]
MDPKLPKTGWWQAACTSSATLNALGQNVVAQLVEENQVGVNNTLCKRQSNDQLMDLNLASLGINDPRNLTKFNPIPLRKGRQQDEENSQYNEAGTESVEVLFTIPNEDNIALLSAHSNGQIAPVKKPKNGWPVVIFSHGITGNRKDVLALSSTLSMAGIASVAIDHPLHGDRGLTDIDGKLVKIDLASVGDYLNFSSLLTARDNARQSSADILTLRLALNSIIDESNSVELDTSTVHFAAHSLGSITGAVAVAIANDSMTGELSAFDHLYAFSSATLNVPASGVPSYLLESPYFEPLIKGPILAETSRSFRAFLAQFPTGKSMAATPPLRAAYLQFMASVSPEQSALIAAQFDAFRFSSQTILDAADPISYAALLGKNTHVLLQLTVGGGVNDDGSTALSDQVNPVATSLPLVGGQALADLIGLEKVSSSQSTDGVVRFISGDHFSLFSPEASVAATSEMQSQVASFIQLEGQGIQIGNSSVIEN